MAAKKTRDRRITQGWLDALRKHKEFSSLPDAAQREFAHMIWTNFTKVRQHSKVAGKTSYTYQELDWRFGRSKFKRLNETAQVFHVSKGWSFEDGKTKSYELAPKYEKSKHQYLRQKVKARAAEAAEFVDMEGERILTAPRAIASKREDGSTARLWQGVRLANVVPLDLAKLGTLYDQTWRDMKRGLDQKSSGQLFGGSTADQEKLRLRAEWAATLLILSTTDEAGQGLFSMRYREVNSGRLYAIDENLQNCPSDVRRAALDGAYDYDISNCHYALLAQLAARFSILCPAIQNYLANKDDVRITIAGHLDTDRENIKQCLLALIYGAALSTSPFTTLGKVLGKETAKQLLALPLFKTLADEVKRVGKAVLENWEVRSGSLMNAAGCGIRQSANAKQKLAHLLQGAEALILKTAVVYLENSNRESVILLQHDGFTTRTRIDIKALEKKIAATTGFHITLEETRIQL